MACIFGYQENRENCPHDFCPFENTTSPYHSDNKRIKKNKKSKDDINIDDE